MPEQWETDIDAAVRRLLDDIPAMDQHSRARSRSALRAAIDSETPGSVAVLDRPEVVAQQPDPATRSRRYRWLGAAAAAAVLAAGVAVVAQTARTDIPQTNAARLLRAAASNIDPGSEPGPGEYRYIRTHAQRAQYLGTADGRTLVPLGETITELWVPTDPTDEWMMRQRLVGEPRWISGSAKEAEEAGIDVDELWPEGKWSAPCGRFDEALDHPVGPDGLGCGKGSWELPTQRWIDGLPRDPEKLLERLRADGGGDVKSQDPSALAVEAGPALESGMLPADVRKALFEAIALMPDIEIVERDVDLGGRTGTALGMQADYNQYDIIVDRDSGDYLGERSVRVTEGSGSTKPGTVTSYSAVSTAVVDKLGQRPPK